jgi:hypothetical protein
MGNWSGSTQTFWCPLFGVGDYSYLGEAMTTPINIFVDVTANPAWANTQSCYTSFMDTPTSGNWYWPTRIDHQSAGYDTVVFAPGTGYVGVISQEVQCQVPNNQMILDVNNDEFFYTN